MNPLQTLVENCTKDHSEVMGALVKELPEYEISYSDFTKIIKLKNSRYSHQIWLNEEHKSVVKSERKPTLSEISLRIILMLIVLGIIYYFKISFAESVLNFSIFIMVFMVLILFNSRIFLPSKKRAAFEQEHLNIAELASNILKQ
jgi:hypothetical protein